MYISYTKIFRIFGCVNKFLQNCKIAALFKIQKLEKAHCSLSLSLSDRSTPRVSVTETGRGGAADSDRQNTPSVRLRRGGWYQHDHHLTADLSRPLDKQQAHQR